MTNPTNNQNQPPYVDPFDQPFGASEPYAEDLAQFDGNFSEAEVDQDNYEPVPDGKYQVNVDNVELKRTKTTDRPMLTWTLRILAPRCRGRKLWRNSVITEKNIKWLKKDLYTCGLGLQRLSDLPANLHRLLNIKLEISKVTNNDYENIYFNRLLVMDAPEGNTATAQSRVDPEKLGRF